MATITKHYPSTLLIILALIITFSFTINTSNATECVGSGAISVYWGQNLNEGTLQKTCATGNYNIVILESLIVYDDGKIPTLNLAGHCGDASHPCSELQSQIEYCQQNNVKVFLSIGQDVTTPTTKGIKKYETEDISQDLANYLLEYYLSGQFGPLGNVTLDGIDLADVSDSEHLHWDELVKAINASTTAKKIYLSASPECVYPDYYLDKAIQTGLFDYIWVEFFYQNPCIYANGDASKLLSAWKTWTSSVPNSLIFLGLVASNDTIGYISPSDLKTKVLPVAKQASNYGGVMIWDRYRDVGSNYTAQIKDSVSKVCRCVCDDGPTPTSFYRLFGSL